MSSPSSSITSAPQIESGTQVCVNLKDCCQSISCSRGRTYSRADQKLLGSALTAVLVGIILLSFGSYCASSSDHCTRDKYGRSVNREVTVGFEFAFGIICLLYSAAVGVYYCICS